MTRKWIFVVVVVSIVWNQIALSAVSIYDWDRPALGYEEASRNLHDTIDFLRSIRSRIDRSQFELDALLEVLEYDARAIVNYVTTETYFEPYTGVLRGAQGTLMSRAGNAADQALLLATLLRDAGYDARISRTRLTDSEAQTLVASLNVPRAAPKHPFSADRLAELVVELEKAAGIPQDDSLPNAALGTPPAGSAASSPIFENSELESARAEATEIVSALRAAGVVLGSGDVIAGIIQESKDYFWVQWREGSSDPWLDAHPAFGQGMPSGFSHVATETFADSLPEELQHQLRIEVTIDQDIAGTLQTHHVMEPWQRPVANLAGVRIQYINLPDRLNSPDGFSDIEKSISESTFFTPLLNQTLAKGAMAFDVDGNIVPPDALQSGFAGVFRQVGAKTEAATSALGSLGSDPDSSSDPDDPVSLVAHHIDYVFVSPGGEETRVRRTIYDKKSASPYQRELKARISENQSFVVATGTFPAAYLIDELLTRVIDAEDVFQFGIDLTYFPDRDKQMKPNRPAAFFAGPQLDLYSRIDTGAAESDGVISYRPEAGLVVHRQELRIGAGSKSVVDIVRNEMRSFGVGHAMPAPRPEATLQIGVWATWVERRFFARNSDAKLLGSAAGILTKARNAGIATRVIGPDNLDQLRTLNIPPESAEAIEADIRNGYHVVVPERPLFVSPAVGAWYRVNTQTGQTLGMAGSGLGATLAEYIVGFIAIGIGTWVLVRTWQDCAGDIPTNPGPMSTSHAVKGLGCVFCAVLAGATAALLVYTVGMEVAASGAAAMAMNVSIFERIKVAIWYLRSQGLPPEAYLAAIQNLIISMVCTELSLADY